MAGRPTGSPPSSKGSSGRRGFRGVRVLGRRLSAGAAGERTPHAVTRPEVSTPAERTRPDRSSPTVSLESRQTLDDAIVRLRSLPVGFTDWVHEMPAWPDGEPKTLGGSTEG